MQFPGLKHKRSVHDIYVHGIMHRKQVTDETEIL